MVEGSDDSDYDTQNGLTQSRIPRQDRIDHVLAKKKRDSIRRREGNFTSYNKAQLRELMVEQNPGIELF